MIRTFNSLLFLKNLHFNTSKVCMCYASIFVQCNKYGTNIYNYYGISFRHQATYKYATLSSNQNKNVAGFDESKAKLILQLNFRSAEDAVPFYNLPWKTLISIYKTTKNDESNNFCTNRLYYIADKIQCSPCVLSQRLVKRTFIYTMSFEWLQNSLNVLLEMNVDNDRILRDLWVLKYHHETIRERLQRVREMGIQNLYPWMVRCNEDILNRFITISQETRNILGESKSTKLYLAERLNIAPDVVDEICSKIPALKTIRVIKVKNFLDFLIKEGFEVEDIANKPRILSSSQKTVKQRLEKLRKLGMNEINLNVLCRSRKDFMKYIEFLEQVQEEPPAS